MKSKVLFLSAALIGASVAVSPAQAHDEYWPLYGLTGLLLIDAITDNHHHHNHRRNDRVIIYDDHRPRHRHTYRRDSSHGGYAAPRYRHEKRFRNDDRPSKDRHRRRDRD